MSNLRKHAETELQFWLNSDDEMSKLMATHILEIIDLFASHGHSGFSAGVASNIINKLLRFEPLGPLTGKDDEWTEISEGLFQNKRCSRVFKDANGLAYDINGIVFEEPDGSRFTNRKSHVNFEFPYTPKTEIVKVEESK